MASEGDVIRCQAEIETYARVNGMNERLMIYGARQIMVGSEIEACEAAIAADPDSEAARHWGVKLNAAQAEMRSVLEHARQVSEAVASERDRPGQITPRRSVFTT